MDSTEVALDVAENGCDPSGDPAAHRRMHGNRGSSGIDAAEEGGDEVHARGAQHQDPLARHALSLQGRRDPPCAGVQALIRQPADLVFLAIAGVAEHIPVPVARGSMLQLPEQRRRRK